MRTEIPKVGVNHYLTDENRKWASPLIKMLALGPLTVRVEKRRYAKQGSKSRKALSIEQRKEQYAAIRGDMMSGDYAVQCRGVRASISGKYLSTKEWLNVLYMGHVHAESKQIMPWDGITESDVRMLLAGEKGVAALRDEMTERYEQLCTRVDPSSRYRPSRELDPTNVVGMFEITSRWLRSGRRLMDVSIKSQETLAPLTEPRWGGLPLPGDELWKRGVFFRFEASLTVGDRRYNAMHEPFQACGPCEFITYVESVGDLLDEKILFAMWARRIGSPFTCMQGSATKYSTESVDRNIHVGGLGVYGRLAQLYRRKERFGVHWGEKSPGRERQGVYDQLGYWSPAYRYGFGPAKPCLSRHNTVDLTSHISRMAAGARAGGAETEADGMEVQRAIIIASINLLAALNTKYTYQTVHRPTDKKSTSSSHSRSGPERIEISEDGLGTWVHEVVRQGESSGVGSGKRWRQPAHVRCATTALVRVVADSLKPNEVIERTETKTLKSGKQRTYYWVRRVRKETIVGGELRGRRAHLVAGLDDEITT